MRQKIDYTTKKKRRIFVRVKMCDMNMQGKCCSYIGEVFIPDGKNRLSDLINNPNGKFLALTNGRVSENKGIRSVPFLLLNKDGIFSVEDLDDKNYADLLQLICGQSP